MALSAKSLQRAKEMVTRIVAQQQAQQPKEVAAQSNNYNSDSGYYNPESDYNNYNYNTPPAEEKKTNGLLIVGLVGVGLLGLIALTKRK